MKFLRICLCFVLMGCSFLPNHSGESSDVRGRIIQPEVLARGGVVEVVPFSAGVHAAAGEGIDKAALLIIRGVGNGLKDGNDRFKMSYEPDIDQLADLRVIGRIEQFDTRDRWKRYVGGTRKRFISVKGKVLDRNGSVIAVFEHDLKKRYQDMTHVNFLLQVGEDIGLFLRSENGEM